MKRRREPPLNAGSPSVGSDDEDYVKTKKRVNHRPRDLPQILLWGVLLLLFPLYLHYSLPSVPSHEPVLSAFSESRARPYVKAITHDIGIRVVGTVGEQRAREYILEQLQSIQEEARRVGTTWMQLEVDVQNPTGSHRFDFVGKKPIKMYTNITNIVARVYCGAECADDGAVLVNTHFDTTLGSPGAVDSAAPIGIMLEMIRNLLHRPKTRHSAIFLFNGAEESLQDASHGFVMEHELTRLVKVVVNLEGCGNSGKAILFQVGDGAMVEAYSAAPYPLATVAANEIFKTGVIVSDTDYRQFVQYANITGFDMAYFQNSYVYHTSRDIYDTIAPGSIQHLGENALEVVSYLMSTELMEQANFTSKDRTVYFDVFGRFLVRLPWHSMVAINILLHTWSAASLLMLASTWNRDFPRLLRSFLRMTLSFIACVLSPMLFGALLSYGLGLKYLWFSREYLPVVYFSPISIAGALALHLRSERHGSDGNQERFTVLGFLAFLNIFTVIFSVFGIMSSYLFSIWIFFLNLGLLFDKLAGGQGNLSLLTYLVGFSLPMMYSIDVQTSLLDLVVPLSNRLGFFAPADVVVGAVTGVLTFFPFSLVLPLSQRYKALPRVFRALLAGSLVIVLGMFLLVSPFDYLHPKRLAMQHHHDLTQNKSFLLVAGFDYYPMDIFHSLVEPHVEGPLQPATEDFAQDWESLYPMNLFIHSMKASAEYPVLESGQELERMTLTADSHWDPVTQQRNITLHCTHPGYPWTVVRFETLAVTSWSIPDVEPFPQEPTNRYIVRQVGGYGQTTWSLNLIVKGNDPIEFNLLGIVHEDSTLTSKIIKGLPEWIDPGIRMVVTEEVFVL